MRIRNGLRSLRETPAGRWMPRLYWARRKFGWGVFQRLCTQNQSSGATRIWCSIISLIFDVRSATEAPVRSKRSVNTYASALDRLCRPQLQSLPLACASQAKQVEANWKPIVQKTESKVHDRQHVDPTK